MKETTVEYCPVCKRELTGAIQTATAEVGGIQFVVMEETPDRNWITCDLCSRTVCKSCCVMPDSGYCNNCFARYRLARHL